MHAAVAEIGCDGMSLRLAVPLRWKATMIGCGGMPHAARVNGGVELDVGKLDLYQQDRLPLSTAAPQLRSNHYTI